ncbi:MAG: hemerythrin [Rhodocyclales bacterium GT-UBC]|nr:MAG: hemerythrin [Rhodocyclales bacterium GT-UBC]
MNRDTAVYLPSSLVIDIEEIDEQHANLFFRLAALKMQCIETNEFPSEAASALLDILEEHCATEERLAGISGVDFSAHAVKHQKMLAAINKAVEEIHEHKIDVFSVLRYIEYWFERHIVEEDLHLGQHLRQTSSRQFVAETRHVRPAHAAAGLPHAPLLAPSHP